MGWMVCLLASGLFTILKLLTTNLFNESRKKTRENLREDEKRCELRKLIHFINSEDSFRKLVYFQLNIVERI